MLRDSPLTDLDGIKPGPVVDLVAIVEIHVLFHGSRVDASEPPDSRGKIAVSRRSILGPQRHALTPIAIETPTVTVVGAGRVHETSESPFTGTLPVLRQRRRFAVFDRRIFAERTLGKHHANKGEGATKAEKHFEQLSIGPLHRSFLLSGDSRVADRADLYCNEMPGKGLSG